MVMDVRAVNEFVAAGNHLGNGTNTGANFNYDYIECVVFPPPPPPTGVCLTRDYSIRGSTVPNQPAGVFWAVVNRLLIILEVIALILSELGWPAVFFEHYFPVLGPDFGLGALGIFQGL